MNIFLDAVLFVASFFSIWFGAGLIISSVEHFAKQLRISSFAVSFFILGILTSVPEFSVGLNSITEKTPEIFVGTLLGGVIVILLFVLPVLAVFGNGIKLHHQLSKQNLILSLVVIAAPTLLVGDKRIGMFEAIFMIVLYGVLFYSVQKKQGLIEAVESNVFRPHLHMLYDFLKVIVGIIIVFFVSHFIVEKTLEFSQFLHMAPFFVSLLILSIGTNLPELSLAIRSIHAGKTDIAFGDYVGSAAANTLLMGVLTLVNEETVVTPNHFFQRFIFTALGLIFFYFFARSNDKITRLEGAILLAVYIAFVLVEVATI